MTRLGNPTAQAAVRSGATTPVIVDRPLASDVQPTDGLLDPMKKAGFFVMVPTVDVDHYIGSNGVESARSDRIIERKQFPLPTTRGTIDYPFGTRRVVDQTWRGDSRLSADEVPSPTQMYYGMQFRMSQARDWYDPAGEMLPMTLPNRALGEGGISIVYPGIEGRVLKFASTNCSAERLHVVHAALHLFGINHLEIRTDDIALDVARMYGIVEQRMLPEGSKQLWEMTRGRSELNTEALRMVCDEVGVGARQELEEIDQQVRELNEDMLLHNEALFRGYCVWDSRAMALENRYVTLVCDAFRTAGWNQNVFFNPDPSMRWFLLDW